MLSESQCEVIKNRVNAEADIPFVREETEGKIIEKVIDVLNPKIEPALRAICPDPYVDCLKIALTEGLPTEQKREQISRILKAELEEPLARELSGNLDIALVPEHVEEGLMKIFSQKTIEEFVEWTVGEIDERMDNRLQASREAAGI